MKECQNPCYGFSPVYHDWTVKRAIVDFPIKIKGNSKRTFGNSLRGTLEGTQYRYTIRKRGKYWNTMLKMDEIPILHFNDWWRLLNVVIHLTCFFISSMYTPEINLHLREKTWEDLEFIGTTIEKPGHWMSYQFHHRVTARNCVFIYHEV